MTLMTRQRSDSLTRYLQAKVTTELHQRVQDAALAESRERGEQRDLKDLVADAMEAYLERHHKPKETP